MAGHSARHFSKVLNFSKKECPIGQKLYKYVTNLTNLLILKDFV
jgi:hypothetical protein